MYKDRIAGVIEELLTISGDSEWVEFKANLDDPKKIGEYISALANAAALCGKGNAWIIWGINNENQEVIGTSFKLRRQRIGNEEIEGWLHHILGMTMYVMGM